MSQSTRESLDIQIKVRWGADIPPTAPVNQLVVQHTPAGEICVTLGFLDAPITTGSPEEQVAQARELQKKGLEIRPVSRIVMTPLVARQLEKALAEQNRIAAQKQLEALSTPPVQ